VQYRHRLEQPAPRSPRARLTVCRGLLAPAISSRACRVCGSPQIRHARRAPSPPRRRWPRPCDNSWLRRGAASGESEWTLRS
jgi:hypothetical protein